MTKEFNLFEVLGVTTGYLLVESGFSRIHELIEHLCGCSVFTHQLPSVASFCKASVIAQFPQLNPEIDSLGVIVEHLVLAIKEKSMLEEGLRRKLIDTYGNSFQITKGEIKNEN